MGILMTVLVIVLHQTIYFLFEDQFMPNKKMNKETDDFTENKIFERDLQLRTFKEILDDR